MARQLGNGALSIRVDIRDCMKFFDGLEVNSRRIQERLMRTTGQGAVSAAKRGMTRTLHNRTGRLKKGIVYTMGHKGDYVSIYSGATSDKETAAKRSVRKGLSHEKGRKARYGFMLATGYTIEAKTSKGLVFQVDGQWKKKRTITVRPKDWLEPSVLRFADSSDLTHRLDKELQKQIDYWEKRITGGNIK